MERTTPLTCGCQASVATRIRIRPRPWRPPRRGRARAGAAPPGLPAQGQPAHDLEPAVVVLGHEGAGFHEIARVDVGDAVDVPHGGVVDVAADHPVHGVLHGILRHHLLEVADEVDGVLHLQLGPGREGPVGEAEAAADDVEHRVGRDGGGVGPVAEVGEPADVAHHDVEVVAVGDEEAPPVRRDVDGGAHHLDAPEGHADIFARELVVVAGDVDHAGALAHLAEQLLHDVVVALRPVPAGLQLPAVDDVADEVDGFGVVVLEEVDDQLVLAAPGAEVEVRDEQGPVMGGLLWHRDTRRSFVDAGDSNHVGRRRRMTARDARRCDERLATMIVSSPVCVAPV